MTVYFTEDGRTVVANVLLGKGGEANVYTVDNVALQAVKIYKTFPNPETVKKITALAGMRPVANSAWPIELVFVDKHCHQAAGYLMPMSSGLTWNNFNMEISRKNVTNYKLDSKFYHTMLTTFATILDDFHAAGLVVGDINDSNILVGQGGACTLLDVDSIQVAGHLCTVARPEFLAPDLQGVSLRDVTRAEKHDLFAMAVLFWQLVFNGVHSHQGAGRPSSIPERIKQRLSVGSSNYLPPPFQRDIQELPPAILDLFSRALNLKPTSSSAWLYTLRNEKFGIEIFISDSLRLVGTKKNHGSKPAGAGFPKNNKLNSSKNSKLLPTNHARVFQFAALLVLLVLASLTWHKMPWSAKESKELAASTSHEDTYSEDKVHASTYSAMERHSEVFVTEEIKPTPIESKSEPPPNIHKTFTDRHNEVFSYELDAKGN
jgi:serine/threonine protein kinase